MKYFFMLTFLAITNTQAADVCEEIRAAMLATIGAGASTTVISKSADQLYSIVKIGGKGSHCEYLRYSFRTLRKPYNGDNVSPKEWTEAILQIKNRK
ncbi:MAG: hypothetical protein JNM93_00175 [Bacteriovoracaceae bacterium]|nr:hypothetical protein [Bacteriovoracaceae bacterium]